MKAAEFPVVAEAKRAAHAQMGFFNRMMAAKTASSSAHRPVVVAVKKSSTTRSAPAKK
jgi:hypothetical protein